MASSLEDLQLELELKSEEVSSLRSQLQRARLELEDEQSRHRKNVRDRDATILNLRTVIANLMAEGEEEEEDEEPDVKQKRWSAQFWEKAAARLDAHIETMTEWCEGVFGLHAKFVLITYERVLMQSTCWEDRCRMIASDGILPTSLPAPNPKLALPRLITDPSCVTPYRVIDASRLTLVKHITECEADNTILRRQLYGLWKLMVHHMTLCLEVCSHKCVCAIEHCEDVFGDVPWQFFFMESLNQLNIDCAYDYAAVQAQEASLRAELYTAAHKDRGAVCLSMEQRNSQSMCHLYESVLREKVFASTRENITRFEMLSQNHSELVQGHVLDRKAWDLLVECVETKLRDVMSFALDRDRVWKTILHQHTISQSHWISLQAAPLLLAVGRATSACIMENWYDEKLYLIMTHLVGAAQMESQQSKWRLELVAMAQREREEIYREFVFGFVRACRVELHRRRTQYESFLLQELYKTKKSVTEGEQARRDILHTFQHLASDYGFQPFAYE